MARPGKRKKRPDGDDAFVDAVYRFLGWVQRNQRAVIVGGIAFVLLVGGIIYYVTYRGNLRQQAAVQLQELQSTLARGPEAGGPSPADAVAQLGSFVDRYAGTPAAREGRILLGRIQLGNDLPEEAIATLRPAAEEMPLDHPIGYAASSMLAAAYAEAGRTEQAMATLARIAENGRFAFQRRDAADRRAQLLIEAGRLREAEAIYSRLVEETNEGTGESYALELGEVRAMLEAAAESAGSGRS